MARLLTYNYFINKYIFNNKICKYNNYIPKEHKSFIFNTIDDVKNFIHYYHVKNHDFGDLNLADEITINDGTYNKTWLIAGFNTQLDSDVNNGTFNKHHLTLIPKDYLFNHVRMHNKNDNSKGFAGTEMFNIIMPEVNNNLSNVLDEYLLPHKMMLSINNLNKVKPFTVKSMLLNYIQAFGLDSIYQSYGNGRYLKSRNKSVNGNFDNGDDIFQLPLFKKNVKYRTIDGYYWWLKNYYFHNCFAGVGHDGRGGYTSATSYGKSSVIRPFICVGKYF